MNNEVEINKLVNFTIKTAKSAGAILLKYYGKELLIKKKSNYNDLVTQADLESEKFILNKIKSKYPEHDIISEETNSGTINSSFRWIIDPLDGTTNFAHNLPIFAVSIGLQYKENTILGVVYNPVVDKCFYATHKNGAFCNNRKISCTSIHTLSNSLLVTGFPYVMDDKWDAGFDIFKTFYSKTQGIRRLGSAALDLCFVAMGRFEGFWEYNLNPWDICAGSIIVKEAGGLVSDWNNNSTPISGIRILATNGLIHKQMVKILTENKFELFWD